MREKAETYIGADYSTRTSDGRIGVSGKSEIPAGDKVGATESLWAISEQAVIEFK